MRTITMTSYYFTVAQSLGLGPLSLSLGLQRLSLESKPGSCILHTYHHIINHKESHSTNSTDILNIIL